MDETCPKLETPPGVELRIVFEHTQGPHAGLFEIMGTMSQLKEHPEDPLPTYAEGFEAQGRVITLASLVRVKRHCAIYRETFIDSEDRFAPPRV